MLDKSPLLAKLHSKSGASLMLALLFIVICIMVGTVVLVAAGIGTERVDASRDQEQTYISLRSAADLINEGMAGLEEYKKTSFTITTTCPESSTHVGEHRNGFTATANELVYSDLTPDQIQTVMGKIASEAVDMVFNTSKKVSWRFTIGDALDNNNNAVNVDKVEMAIEMYANYDISIKLFFADVNDELAKYAPLTLYYVCTKSNTDFGKTTLTADDLVELQKLADKTAFSPAEANGIIYADVDGNPVYPLLCIVSSSVFDQDTGTTQTVNTPYNKELTTVIHSYSWELTKVSKGVLAS